MKHLNALKGLLIGSAFLLAGVTQNLSAETIRMSSWIPPTHPLMSEVLIPWSKEIAEVTEGRVRVRILPASIGSPAQQYDVAASGQADIVYGNQSYTSGRFSNYAFVELPRNGDNAIATSVAYWNTYDKYLAADDELKDIKLLGLFTHGPGQIFTSGHVIKNLHDNGGIKIRGGGVAATRVIEALGITAVQAPITQTAELLTNRIVDGFSLDPTGIATFGFYDYADNRFSIEGGLYNVSFFVGMNVDTWERLSQQDKAAIEAISGAVLARRAGEMWQGLIENAYEEFEIRGYVLSKPEGDFATELQEVFVGFEEDWITKAAKNGIDGRVVLDAYRAEVARLSAENRDIQE